MGHQIIKQPDGRLAIYSSVVDAWICWDMSEADVENYYAERAANDARESARRTVNHVMAGNPSEVYCQFAMTFAEANAHSKAGQGGDQGPEGPVDAELYRELLHPDGMEDDGDTMDSHLIFGSNADDEPGHGYWEVGDA